MSQEGLDIRIYLCSTCGDARAEKGALASLVLPELRRRASSFGAQVTLVDPETFSPDKRGLAQRLEAIESCLPFFLCVLGDTCGPLLSAVPGDPGAEHLWLAGSRGLSVAEAEISFALQDPDRARACFFYVYPQDPGQSPSDASSEEGGRLATLKERISSSGFSIVDIDLASESVTESGQTGVELFARRVLEDLWQAILNEVVKAPLKRVRLPSERVPAFHESVQFTVYRPRSVEPEQWYSLLAFAHLGDLPPELRGSEKDPIQRVRERAEKTLGNRLRDYASVTQDSLHGLPEESEVTFLLDLPGFRVNPPRAVFHWLESVHLEEFRIRAGAELHGRTVRGRLSVFWGSILLADLPLSIRVDLNAVDAREGSPAEPAAVRPFRNIFASYSHRDQIIVEQFERFAEALGDRYLRDVTHLRSGEVWDDRLCDLIGQAHVFQLFWSKNAMRSPFVEREWRYALSLGRDHFIRPVYWEEPLPSSLELGLPPAELTRLHFQLLQGGTGAHAPQVATTLTVFSVEERPGTIAAPLPSPPVTASTIAAPAAQERRTSRWLPGLAALFVGVLGVWVALRSPLLSGSPTPAKSVEVTGSSVAEPAQLTGAPLSTYTKDGGGGVVASAPDAPEPTAASTRPAPFPRESSPLPRTQASSPGPSEPTPQPVAPRPSAPVPTPTSLPVSPSAPSSPTPLEPPKGPDVPSSPRVRMGDLVERGPGVIGPDLVDLPIARYPAAARGMQQVADVSVRLLVDETGKVLQAVTEGERVGFGFEEEALAAARRATFTPPAIDGRRVKMWTTLVFEFRP